MKVNERGHGNHKGKKLKNNKTAFRLKLSELLQDSNICVLLAGHDIVRDSRWATQSSCKSKASSHKENTKNDEYSQNKDLNSKPFEDFGPKKEQTIYSQHWKSTESIIRL